MFWRNRQKKIPTKQERAATIKDLFHDLEVSNDFTTFEHKKETMSCWISFFKTLVDVEYVHRDVLPFIYEGKIQNLKDIKANLPVEDIILTRDAHTVQEKVMQGYIVVQMKKYDSECLVFSAIAIQGRQIDKPEIETSIIGPKEAFVESIDANLNLVRKRVPIPKFHVKEIQIGKISKTRVNMLYIEGIANKENVNTVLQRLNEIEYDHMIDAAVLSQMMGDNQHSPFPQFIDTERPDRVAGTLYEGKIVILVDGSPHALTCPTTIVEFFSAFDDYFLVWHFASAFRLLRLFAVAFSVLSSPMYVAVLTYHYQLIPKDLLQTLISSRSMIPFPPFLEALILELLIELLREAGARLPTKIGQTIGIVGGIVIGTASVQAGLTSNVLLIMVAAAALASFTTPNYLMGTTIRLIRFPFLIAAQLWGIIGIALCFGFFVAHLLKLTSLGRPYIEPIYPLRMTDLKDAFIRLPYGKQSTRPMFLRPQDPGRFNYDRAREKNDIDE
ncbi:GerA spore germination protein [Scopulibacillus darangshiensis]|uniref:GerA spore germination protein n=1 Tax=Scopulibacillus darangshiensis TaxID=442528 RepID=A0A4V2SMB4_9BACL|nr:spore germination protein [Scopulibacillus darangshiensis]TCP26626.1 GerA spore germination protein [Scopulibacillus darangshiensis]